MISPVMLILICVRHTLSHLTEHEIREEDFTDNRLTILPRYLSVREVWEKIENDLSGQSVFMKCGQLTRQRLSPCKEHQALLGALTTR